MTLETVTIPPFITWQQFGCYSEKYFDRYIKGVELEVTERELQTITVRDETGDEWVIHRTLLIDNKREAEFENYPWRTELASYQISQDNARIKQEMRNKILEKSIARNRLQINLIRLVTRFFESRIMSEDEYYWWVGYTRLSLEEDLKSSIEYLESIFENHQKEAA